MKKIAAIAAIWTLLFLWNGITFAVAPPAKSKETVAPPKPGPVTSKPPGPKTMTTPGAAGTPAFVDLAVTDIQVQEVGLGALLRITVKNLGTASADAGLYKLHILLDGIPLPEGNQPLFNARSPIGPNQTRVTGVVPNKSGRVAIAVFLLSDGAAKTDPDNNHRLARTLDIPVIDPDLMITDLALTRDNRIRVTVRNNGGYARRRGTMEVYAENKKIDTIEALGWPHPQKNMEVTTKNRVTGTCTVRAVVNPDKSIQEINYENNALEKQFTAHARPDLTVVKLGYWRGGDPLRYGLVIVVANIGKGTSPRSIKADVFNVSRGQAARHIAAVNLEGPIESGREKRFDTDIASIGSVLDVLQLTLGPHDPVLFRVTLDPHNAIDEERENNNSLTSSLELLE